MTKVLSMLFILQLAARIKRLVASCETLVDVAVAAGLLRGMLLKDLHMVRDASLSAEVVRRLLLALGFVLHGASSGTREAARGAGGHGTEEALAAARETARWDQAPRGVKEGRALADAPELGHRSDARVRAV